MRRSINQARGKRKYVFSCIEDPTFTGDVNETYGLTKEIINVYHENKPVCSLVERFPFANWLVLLPIKNHEKKNRYRYYEKGVYSGFSIDQLRQPIMFSLKEDVYEVRLHNNSYCSMMKNNEQVGLYHRSLVPGQNKNTYSILFNEAKVPFHIIFLLCIVIDLTHFSIDGNRSVKAISFTKNYDERILWRPEDTQEGGDLTEQN